MDSKLYSVNVSNLEVRPEPSQSSKVYLRRDTIVRLFSGTKQYKKEEWVKICTVSDPIISGYVPKKYLRKI